MFKIYFCDGEKIIREKYLEVIQGIREECGCIICYRNFANGNEMLEYINQNSDEADLIYLDVTMPGRNGVDTARELRRIGWTAEIVFLTSCEEFAFNCADLYPARILLKKNVPDIKEAFYKAMRTAKEKKENVVSFFSEDIERTFPIENILYIVSYGPGTRVVLKNDELSCEDSLDLFGAKLCDKYFAYVQKNCIVNVKEAVDILDKFLILSNGQQLRIQEDYRVKLMECISDYLSSMI